MKILIHSGRVKPFFSKREQLLRMLIAAKHDVTVGGYEANCEKECNEFGVEYVQVPMSRAGLNPFEDIKTLWAYYRIFKAQKYDVVHSYTAKPNIYGSIAARLAGIKRIYPVVNGLGYAFIGNDAKTRIVRLAISVLYKLGFACADKVIFQNKDDADELVKRYIIRKDKCVVVAGSGVDLDAYPYSPLESQNCFLMATRLLRTKGVMQYCEAARMLKRQYPLARFMLAGDYDKNPDGVKVEEIQPYITDGSVEYLGLVSDMVSALKMCSVFVLPSFYREGVPHANLEAMSIGRAIITTDMPGCKETLNGKNGLMVEAESTESLIKAMRWMLDNPIEVEKMGNESRKYAEERFDVNIVNTQMIKTMQIR